MGDSIYNFAFHVLGFPLSVSFFCRPLPAALLPRTRRGAERSGPQGGGGGPRPGAVPSAPPEPALRCRPRERSLGVSLVPSEHVQCPRKTLIDCERYQSVVGREMGGPAVNLALRLTCLFVFSLLVDLVPGSRLSECSTSAEMVLSEGDRT